MQTSDGWTIGRAIYEVVTRCKDRSRVQSFCCETKNSLVVASARAENYAFGAAPAWWCAYTSVQLRTPVTWLPTPANNVWLIQKMWRWAHRIIPIFRVRFSVCVFAFAVSFFPRRGNICTRNWVMCWSWTRLETSANWQRINETYSDWTAQA